MCSAETAPVLQVIFTQTFTHDSQADLGVTGYFVTTLCNILLCWFVCGRIKEKISTTVYMP